MATNQVSNTAPRTSSGSSKSQSSRSVNQPDKQLSQIEKSVTHLLVATKQLLETLTQWSRNQAQEEEVSDVYVRLGYEFNLACRAFNSIGVETADLGPVPDLLRSILEDTLSQPASPQSLDNFLPRIRDIIINLLHGLKRKQAKLRSRSGKEHAGNGQAPTRQASGGSLESDQTRLTNMLDDISPQTQSRRGRGMVESATANEGLDGVPPRTASNIGDSDAIPDRYNLRRDMHKNASTLSATGSSPSSSAASKVPAPPTYSESSSQAQHELSPEPTSSPKFPQPPKPPPKQMDAMAALQSGKDLERRASRRFSKNQYSKGLGSGQYAVPPIPSAQNSPIPNRGRDDRESMNAVQSRKSVHQPRHQRYASRHGDSSPLRNGAHKAPEPITEESPESSRQLYPLDTATQRTREESPTARTSGEMQRQGDELSLRDKPLISATLNSPGPTLPPPSPATSVEESAKPVPPEHQHTPRRQAEQPSPVSVGKDEAVVTPIISQQFVLEDSPPPPGKELTLFLQYKSKIKKFVLPDGADELTVARLQLAFIEKFAWNTHNNGVDLPEIYIQDPVSGVRHELEDLSDVKDRAVLALNVEVLDEVKKHFDDGIGGLRKILDGVRGTLEGQSASIERYSDRLLETSKDMAKVSATPRKPIAKMAPAQTGRSTPVASAASLAEVQNLRRDIAILRQKHATMSADFAASMNSIKEKSINAKSLAVDSVMPKVEANAGRAHVNHGKKLLLQDSEALVNRVDDLSDLVEDLRKDVVTRGVRPRPRQLEDVSKDISSTIKELTKMKDFLKREKPIWTKIWEKELDLVCQERDELTQQEDLMADLHGDLGDLSGVFKLVEEATKQQNLQNGGSSGLRSTSRSLPIDAAVDPQRAKDGVLGEVRALQPNHEHRLEAIERAEKARQRELAARKGGEFQREVENFVEEGKLRKTGGAEEVDRLRRSKDEKARKENWERMQQRQAEMDAAEAAEPEANTDVADDYDGAGQGSATVDGEVPADINGQSQQQTDTPADRGGGGDATQNTVDTAIHSNPGQQRPQAHGQSNPGSPNSPQSGSKNSWLPAIFSG